MIKEAQEELDNLKYVAQDSAARYDFLRSVIIEYKAVLRYTERLAEVAEKMSKTEKNKKRAAELKMIADTLRWYLQIRPGLL